jgi:DNA-binding IclR family transcriptional regulator
MAKEGNTIQSVDRAIEILRSFEKNEELGVTEISKLTGLHKSTAFNLISTLEKAGLMAKDSNSGRYRLGMELFRLGTMVNSNIRKICEPYLQMLVDEFSETVNLVARNDLLVIYLDKKDSPHSMRITTEEGTRLPMYITAVGKAMMSTLSDDEIKSILRNVRLVKFTENTLTDKEAIRLQIQFARENGYAEDLQEYENGLTCVGAPIMDHTGRASYAISVSGPNSRMTKEVRRKIGERLVELTAQISKKLGYYKTMY